MSVLLTVALLSRRVEAETTEPISFDEALGLAPRHPAVEGAQAAWKEKRDLDGAMPSRATLNPQISVQPGFRFAPAVDRQPELLAEILQPWNLAGQGAARQETVVWEERALEAETRVATLSQKLAIAQSWMAAWGAGRALEDAERQSKLAASLAALVNKSAQWGAATAADVAEAEAFASEIELGRVAAEGEQCARGVELRRLLARDGVGPLATRGPLPEAPVPDGTHLPEALAQLEHLPGVQQRNLFARAERARVVEEAAARGSVLALGVVLQADAPGGLVLSAAGRLTPALWDRGERERGTMASAARRRETELAEAKLDARAALTLAFHEVEHSREVLTLIETKLMPQTSRAAEGRRRLFEMGRGTLPEVLVAERRGVAAAAQARQARAEHAWARVKLWLLLAPLALGGGAS
jgi:outer membrane protein TolC